MDETLSTIAALATAPAPAGIAVIRVSGPKTRTALRALFRAKHDPVSEPRVLVFGEILDHPTGQVIDQALAVYMPGPNSYTGDDVAEFQFHGSPVLVQRILRSLFAYGVSPAEAGEFTKRAFLNGKVDLVQAEAICDLINATSDQALRLAGEHLKGRFSQAVNQIGEPLREALAEIEAALDFPDEGIPPVRADALCEAFKTAQKQINNLLETYTFGQVVKEGFRVLLCGQPNVGKSSLLNLLLGSDRAIVTEVSGTTRDLIEEQAILGGFRFVFCDSAGLRDSQDEVEKIGIELAKERVSWADLVLFVVDASDTSRDWEHVLNYLRGRAKKIWMITNKIDLNPNAFSSFFCDSQTCAQNFYISVKTQNGYEALLQALVDEVSHTAVNQAEANQIITNERHRTCLSRAFESLSKVLQNIQGERPLELVSSDLRTALQSLEEIVGKTYTEDILGRIFSRFCIGK